MLKTFVTAVVLVCVSTPALAKQEPYGECPGAIIDYAYYRAKYRDDYVPVQVQVAANRALRTCHKAGINVPITVAEYNNQQRELVDAREVLRYQSPFYTGEESWRRP